MKELIVGKKNRPAATGTVKIKIFLTKYNT
jgi:hypothetical protein